MKKHLLVAAVVFTAVSAQASKARLDALGNSEHIVDIQEVFTHEPDQALNYEAATVEFGSSTANQEAEGGFIRKMGDSAWSLYLGKSSTTFKAFTDGVIDDSGITTGAGILRSMFSQANPLQVTYASKAGDINWGAGLFYVGNNFKDQSYSDTATFTGDVKQNIAGLLVGANNGVWDAQLRIGLMGEVKATGPIAGLVGGAAAAINAADEIEAKSTSSLKASGGYLMDTMYFFGGYEMGAGEVKAGTNDLVDATNSTLTLGVVNSHKKDGVDFFYGVSAVVTNTKEDIADTKDESTRFPLIVGVEAEVNSWLVLRGSLTQDLGLLSSTKPDGSSAGSVDDSTTTALGAGFKWGKATIDTVIATGTTGNFGTDTGTAAGNIFGQASVTYNF